MRSPRPEARHAAVGVRPADDLSRKPARSEQAAEPELSLCTATDETTRKLASTEETERAAAKLAVFRVKTADRAPACATGNDRARSSDRRASGQRHGCGFIAAREFDSETPSPNRHVCCLRPGWPSRGPAHWHRQVRLLRLRRLGSTLALAPWDPSDPALERTRSGKVRSGILLGQSLGP
jgi:hypothetical protein